MKKLIAKGFAAFNSGDRTLAIECFTAAAELGSVKAQSMLGWLCYHGHGITADRERAVYWYRRAAEGGDAHACAMLGDAYEWSWGSLPRNPAEAARWYRKALDNNPREPYHLWKMARCYEEGYGVAEDMAEALRLYREGARLGDPDCKEALERLEAAACGELTVDN